MTKKILTVFLEHGVHKIRVTDGACRHLTTLNFAVRNVYTQCLSSFELGISTRLRDGPDGRPNSRAALHSSRKK